MFALTLLAVVAAVNLVAFAVARLFGLDDEF